MLHQDLGLLASNIGALNTWPAALASHARAKGELSFELGG